jgi:hypothetical protein
MMLPGPTERLGFFVHGCLSIDNTAETLFSWGQRRRLNMEVEIPTAALAEAT